MGQGEASPRFGPFGERAPVTFAISFMIVTALAVVVSEGASIPGDSAAANLAESIRADWLTEAMRAITDIGSGTVVGTILVFAALGLAANRKWEELATTLLGGALLWFGVAELKDGISRARPDDGLLSTETHSFPSGHAAHATIYVYLAILITHLSGKRREGMWLIGIAIGLCAAIGLSRIYLGVHYLSDVVGGWAFGAGAFTLWAVITLARGRLRHNLDSDER